MSTSTQPPQPALAIPASTTAPITSTTTTQTTNRPALPPTTSSNAFLPIHASSKLDMSVSPAAYLDPNVAITGSFPIKIGPGTVIHPRVRLVATHAPLHIGANCLIGEKSQLGLPSSKTSPPSPDSPTTIEDEVQIQPLVTVFVSARLQTASVVETGASVASGASVGAHAKVCAGCSVVDGEVEVGEWEVVYGCNPVRRRRRARDGEVEEGRLKALGREREGTKRVLAEGSKMMAGRGKGKA